MEPTKLTDLWQLRMRGLCLGRLQDSLVVGSKLDADASAATCRLAFSGRLVAPLDLSDLTQLARLRVFRCPLPLSLPGPAPPDTHHLTFPFAHAVEHATCLFEQTMLVGDGSFEEPARLRRAAALQQQTGNAP